jgi:outer membrane protein W
MKVNLMKFYIPILLLFSSNVFSDQNIKKGVQSIAGSISYDRYNNSFGHSSQLQITPKYIYFIANNLGIGAVVGLGKYKNSSYDEDSYALGPIIRYYFLGANLLPYASFDYVYGKAKFTGDDVVNDAYTSKNMSVAIGVDYFVASNVAIETEIKHTATKQKIEYEAAFSTPSSTDESNSVTSFNVGVNVFF